MLQLESPLPIVLCFPLIAFLIVLVHELGHVFGGLCSGHRFHMLVAGPLKISRGVRGFTCEINRSLAMAGGLAVCVPTQFDSFRRRRFWLVAGGPIASIGLAILCWTAAYCISHHIPFLSDALIISSLLSALIAFVTLLPHSSGGFPSDGFQLLGLLGKRTDSEKLGFVSLLYSLSVSGTRPRDLPREIIEMGVESGSSEPSIDASSELFAYLHYLDHGMIDLAKRHLEKSLQDFDRLPQGIKQGYALEAAYFAWVHLHDKKRALDWFNKGNGGLVDPAARSRVEAAMLLMDGRLNEAQSKIELARTQLDKSSDRGGALAESDMLDRIEQLILTKRG